MNSDKKPYNDKKMSEKLTEAAKKAANANKFIGELENQAFGKTESKHSDNLEDNQR